MKITQDVRDYAAKLNEARRGAGRRRRRMIDPAQRKPAWPR